MTHKLAAKFIVAQHVAAQRMTGRERGASALEYVGMVLVAAFLVGAVYAAFEGAGLTDKVKTAVNDILTGAPST